MFKKMAYIAETDKKVSAKKSAAFTFELQVRKRVFTSNYRSTETIKQLSVGAKNFLYHQARFDFVVQDLIKRPFLATETAIMLASLTLKLKYQTQLLRSKESAPSPE